jgi:hypothetical protein
MSKQSRRGFLKQTAVLIAALPCVGLIGKTLEVYAKEIAPLPPGATPFSESDPVAQALGFHQDAKKTDFTRYPDRKKPAAKNQFCQYCVQYNKLNDGWGKCNVMNGVVSAQGWCASWTKKA